METGACPSCGADMLTEGSSIAVVDRRVDLMITKEKSRKKAITPAGTRSTELVAPVDREVTTMLSLEQQILDNFDTQMNIQRQLFDLQDNVRGLTRAMKL